MRATRTMVTLALVVAVAGCALRAKPKAMISREGILTHGETLTYVGVDFSRTVFYDQYFQFADVAHGKIQSWNQRALEDIQGQFPMPVTSDLAVSDKLNNKVSERAFVTTPPDPAKWALTDSVVHQEITPWVDKKQSGHALLIVAEQLSKPSGVVAHYVVFDRRSGEIVLLDQLTGNAGGFGIHNYYLNGLKDVANHARKAIAALVR
ncbi:MAG: hypothetical protein HY271_19235 [Deltaproteobacteria bacterium]|nr:hypothetical protein [Deltaproteobacteria bacterium]